MLQDEADEALMMRYQEGEVRAFEVLLHRHRKPLYNFVIRYISSREAAEDLVQEVFLRVLKGAQKYQQKAKFTTWLYTIARNLCIDYSRRQKHRKVASLDQPTSSASESGTLMEVIPSGTATSDREIYNAQLAQAMHRAVRSLPGDQREVFLMREFLNLSFKEIGQIIGISENTVKSRMRYALSKLRLDLEQYKDPPRAP